MTSIASKMNKFSSKRRVIADRLHKLIDDERISEDIFALTMNMFDRFLHRMNTTIVVNDRSTQLIALCCYSLAKKLRHTSSITNENDQLTMIFLQEKYNDKEIFDTEQTITETLDWDLICPVPHDYIEVFLKFLRNADEKNKVRLHVQILLALAICEMNTLTIVPNLLAGACVKVAIKGLRLSISPSIDDRFIQLINCNRSEFLHSQQLIEQFFQSCLQEILPSPKRRCLAPIETSPQQRRTKVK